uniref:MDR efflux pump ABC3 n=1 Tax=Ganoderma boninense TaxID=34458 RepID=A0A5K1K7I7_9APHY|nr:MDR efflux pump ABC3 [Ganoderma boninense]
MRSLIHRVHRRLLRGHFGHGRRKSRVTKALALLVESGTIYCLLLIIVVVYQASSALFAAPDVHQNAFLRTVADYTYTCFIPVIAIYPVLIIVIVALNWSPFEHGLARTDADGAPLGPGGEDGGACQPTRVTLNVNGATISTVVFTDTSGMRCIQESPGESEEGGALGAESKRGPAIMVV